MPSRRRGPRVAPGTLLAHVGRCVRRRRTALGWTLGDLSARSGLSPRFLSEVEAGRANISVVNLEAVAQALGATGAELLAGAHARDGRGCIALLGLRGAGKSTVGPRVASRLGLPFYELDGLVEADASLSIADLLAPGSETAYRSAELRVLREFLDGHDRAVFAASGGIVTSPDAFELLLERCTTVWLRARPHDHVDRVLKQGDTRPMSGRLHALSDVRALLSDREPLYRRADLAVDTSALGIAGTVDALVARLRAAAPPGAGAP